MLSNFPLPSLPAIHREPTKKDNKQNFYDVKNEQGGVAIQAIDDALNELQVLYYTFVVVHYDFAGLRELVTNGSPESGPA